MTSLQFDDATAGNAFECLEIIYIAGNNLYCQKLESLAYISATGSMGLCLLLLTQIFLKIKCSWVKKCGRKRILTWNSHLRSFWVIHFAIINHRPTRSSISSHNIAGLISEVSEVATQIAKKLPLLTTTLSFDAPDKRNPCKYLHAPYISRFQSHWPTFLSPIVWVYILIQICAVCSKRCIFPAPECILAVQGYPRMMILVPMKSTYVTSY